jgi:adenosine deaminase
MRTFALFGCAAAVVWTQLVGAQTSVSDSRGGEASTARRFEALKGDPIRLRAFLREMPKGGDLHNHLTGAIYAERYLQWAAEDGQCLALATMSIVAGPCDGKAAIAATAVVQNLQLFDQAVDAMSMRHWDVSRNGHDQFFASFGKFGPPSDRTGDMLAEVAANAAAERVSYLELMLTPFGGATALGRSIPAGPDLAQWRDRLLAAGVGDRIVKPARANLDVAEARRREALHCATDKPDPGCQVTIRYIAQVGRSRTPQEVFAQMVAWFELVEADSRVVSLNLVQPEDDPVAVRDFALHMSMLDYLHGLHPQVPITLHAGELVDGLVPPSALRSHVRDSIRVGHARRIGHATAAVLEDDPFGLLRELSEKQVLVEVAMSSAAQILGVSGPHHPLKKFLAANVPVALVTDDMGVSRSTHTLEFVKAVTDHGLDYLTLKRLVRNSIEYSFADAATKTRLRADLERAFAEFERRPPA